jgi:leucyl aminopeptidase (aminopeptidase T)
MVQPISIAMRYASPNNADSELKEWGMAQTGTESTISGRSTDAWQPDWERLADQIVNRTLRVQSGERVVYLADPEAHPALLEAVRASVLRAGGVEQATILAWTERIVKLRTAQPTWPGSEIFTREARAHADVFNTADVFMWLPTGPEGSSRITHWETEWILGRWRGRGLHFHWFTDPAKPLGHPIHAELERIYERGILELDYAAHARLQEKVVTAIRGKRLRVTTPAGTDVTLTCPADGWYHTNDGDGSHERVLRATCARDREHELPCGAVRSVPAPNSVDGVIALRGGVLPRRQVAWNGFGLDIGAFAEHLDIVFKDGHITELRAGAKQAAMDEQRKTFRGDWDRLGEIVIGTNPLLPTPKEASMPTYWGFGDGWFRFHLGENLESGGTFQGNVWINLWVGDATISADGETIVRDGKLVIG